MAGLIRRALRKLIDNELGVMGGELNDIERKIDDLEVQVSSYRTRFELLQARTGMRVKRAERRGELAEGPDDLRAQNPEEEAMLRELRNGRFPEGTWQ